MEGLMFGSGTKSQVVLLDPIIHPHSIFIFTSGTEVVLYLS